MNVNIGKSETWEDARGSSVKGKYDKSIGAEMMSFVLCDEKIRVYE